FFQAEVGIRDYKVTGVQTCALPISIALVAPESGDQRTRESTQYDLGQATMSMMLAAADLGIGSSHAAVTDQELARHLLDFPEDRSEERRVGKSVDRGGRRIDSKKRI